MWAAEMVRGRPGGVGVEGEVEEVEGEGERVRLMMREET